MQEVFKRIGSSLSGLNYLANQMMELDEIEYFRLRFRLDDMERRRLYFRGHTDCISYLKKIGALD